jgi:hypothetical protein
LHSEIDAVAENASNARAELSNDLADASALYRMASSG